MRNPERFNQDQKHLTCPSLETVAEVRLLLPFLYHFHRLPSLQTAPKSLEHLRPKPLTLKCLSKKSLKSIATYEFNHNMNQKIDLRNLFKINHQLWLGIMRRLPLMDEEKQGRLLLYEHRTLFQTKIIRGIWKDPDVLLIVLLCPVRHHFYPRLHILPEFLYHTLPVHQRECIIQLHIEKKTFVVNLVHVLLVIGLLKDVRQVGHHRFRLLPIDLLLQGELFRVVEKGVIVMADQPDTEIVPTRGHPDVLHEKDLPFLVDTSHLVEVDHVQKIVMSGLDQVDHLPIATVQTGPVLDLDIVLAVQDVLREVHAHHLVLHLEASTGTILIEMFIWKTNTRLPVWQPSCWKKEVWKDETLLVDCSLNPTLQALRVLLQLKITITWSECSLYLRTRILYQSRVHLIIHHQAIHRSLRLCNRWLLHHHRLSRQ